MPRLISKLESGGNRTGKNGRLRRTAEVTARDTALLTRMKRAVQRGMKKTPQ